MSYRVTPISGLTLDAVGSILRAEPGGKTMGCDITISFVIRGKVALCGTLSTENSVVYVTVFYGVRPESESTNRMPQRQPS